MTFRIRNFLSRIFGQADKHPTLSFEEERKLQALRRLNSDECSTYIGVMALSYAIATKDLSFAEYLLKERQIPADGCYGVKSAPLYALMDYQPAQNQSEIACLLKKYGIDFNVWDLDKHPVSTQLQPFISPDNNVTISAPEHIDYLVNSPLSSMKEKEVDSHINAYALNFACLTGKLAEIVFLIKDKNMSASGFLYQCETPMEAALRGNINEAQELLRFYTEEKTEHFMGGQYPLP